MDLPETSAPLVVLVLTFALDLFGMISYTTSENRVILRGRILTQNKLRYCSLFYDCRTARSSV